MQKPPQLVVLAGPNGAGKSTVAPDLLRDLFGIHHFVNADVIAHGLSGFDPTAAATLAGRIMLEQLLALADCRDNFAFETTLASRSLVSRIRERSRVGYETHLVFLALPSPEIAVARVAARVRAGGHNVPESTIRRRFSRGLSNLFRLYMPLVDRWQVLDASVRDVPPVIAQGGAGLDTQVLMSIEWQTTELRHGDA